METKRNEATLQRPEGDRVLDASYVFMDIPAYVQQILQEKAWFENDRNGITVFKSSSVSIVIAGLKAGAEMIDKAVKAYLTIQVLKGTVNITTPDGDIEANDHQVITFHPKIAHSVKAITNSIILITSFHEVE